MSRGWWQRMMRAVNEDRARLGVSFAWPQHTDLTDEQIRIARDEGAAPSVLPPDAGRTVETTDLHAPRPEEIAALLPTGTPTTFTAYAGATSYDVYHDGYVTAVAPDGTILGSRRAWPGEVIQMASPVPNADGSGMGVPVGWQPGPTPVFGEGPTMPMRSLSNENHDRVWIAQGDHVEAMGVGDTPQEASIEYARAVADLLRPTSGPDAFDGKAAIRAQLAACRGECGDGPPDYSEWAR